MVDGDRLDRLRAQFGIAFLLEDVEQDVRFVGHHKRLEHRHAHVAVVGPHIEGLQGVCRIDEPQDLDGLGLQGRIRLVFRNRHGQVPGVLVDHDHRVQHREAVAFADGVGVDVAQDVRGTGATGDADALNCVEPQFRIGLRCQDVAERFRIVGDTHRVQYGAAAVRVLDGRIEFPQGIGCVDGTQGGDRLVLDLRVLLLADDPDQQVCGVRADPGVHDGPAHGRVRAGTIQFTQQFHGFVGIGHAKGLDRLDLQVRVLCIPGDRCDGLLGRRFVADTEHEQGIPAGAVGGGLLEQVHHQRQGPLGIAFHETTQGIQAQFFIHQPVFGRHIFTGYGQGPRIIDPRAVRVAALELSNQAFGGAQVAFFLPRIGLPVEGSRPLRFFPFALGSLEGARRLFPLLGADCCLTLFVGRFLCRGAHRQGNRGGKHA